MWDGVWGDFVVVVMDICIEGRCFVYGSWLWCVCKCLKV